MEEREAGEQLPHLSQVVDQYMQPGVRWPCVQIPAPPYISFLRFNFLICTIGAIIFTLMRLFQNLRGYAFHMLTWYPAQKALSNHQPSLFLNNETLGISRAKGQGQLKAL